MLVEFSIVPMGKGESVSALVAKVIDVVERSGLPCQTHAMGTLIEGSWDECMKVVKQCHDLAKRNAPRVYTKITIDDKKGKKKLMTRKLESLERKLGRSINK